MKDTTPTKTLKPNWGFQHRIFYVKWYFKCYSSKKIMYEQFYPFFETDKAPEIRKMTIQIKMPKFDTFGTV